MAWFVHQQQLDSPFGNAEHSVPGIFRCGACKVPSTIPVSVESRRKRGLEEVSSPSIKRTKRAFGLWWSGDGSGRNGRSPFRLSFNARLHPHSRVQRHCRS